MSEKTRILDFLRSLLILKKFMMANTISEVSFPMFDIDRGIDNFSFIYSALSLIFRPEDSLVIRLYEKYPLGVLS